MVAGSVAALSEVFGELQRAAGATERLVELLQAEDPVPTRSARGAAEPGARRDRVRGRDLLPIPARPGISALDDVDLHDPPGETVALVGPSGAGKTDDHPASAALLRSRRGAGTLDGVPLDAISRGGISATTSRWFRRIR